jgi:hypothetical protein
MLWRASNRPTEGGLVAVGCTGRSLRYLRVAPLPTDEQSPIPRGSQPEPREVNSVDEETPTHIAKRVIPRRVVLKRIGAGAALAWSVPMITTVKATPQNTCPPSDCGFNVCQPACDDRPCAQQPNNCACFPTMINPAFCYCGDLLDGLCESFQPCNTNEDCGFGGEVCGECVASCCPTGICMKPCLNAPRRPRPRTGARLTK